MARPLRPLLLLLTVATLGVAIWWWGGGTAPERPAEEAAAAAGVAVPHTQGAPDAAPTAVEAPQRSAATSGAPTSAFPPRASLQGASFTLRVTDEGGAPLAGARVRCGTPEYGHYGYFDDREWEDSPLPIHAESFTDADGRARLGGLPTHEQLMLAADAPGRTRAQRLLRTAGEGEELEVGSWALQEVAPVTLEFVTADGSPAAEVEFRLYVHGERDDLRDLEFTGRADARGTATLEHVPPLAAHAWVHGRGRYVTESIEALRPGQRSARLVVQRGHAVTGRLLEADGTPVAGARVGIWQLRSFDVEVGTQATPWDVSHQDWESFLEGVPTGPDGEFSCEGLEDERELFALTAFVPPNLLYASVWFDRTTGLEFQLPVRHALRGRVHGPFDPAQAFMRVKFKQDTRGRFTFHPPDVPCAADGSFDLLLPEGTWAVQVLYPGGAEDLEEDCVLTADVDLGVREVGAGGSLVLHCPDAERLPDPEVRLERWESPRRSRLGDTEEDWQRVSTTPERVSADLWRFRGLAPGRYRLILDATGCEPSAVEVTLQARETIESVLTLVPTGSVTIEILDHVGQRVTTREVELIGVTSKPLTEREAQLEDLSPWMHPTYPLAFASDGLARAADLPAGVYAVQLAHAEGVATGFGVEGVEIGRVTVEAGQTTALQYSLEAMGQVQFLVRAGGQPVASARVAYWLFDEEQRLGFDELHDPDSGGVTGADGIYVAAALAPGAYLAGVRAREDAAWTLREFTVVAGTQSIELEPARGRVRGRVERADGGPAAARVLLCSEDVARRTQDLDEHAAPLKIEDLRWLAGTAMLETSEAGAFEFAGVPPGRYRVGAADDDDAAGWSAWFELAADATTELGALTLLPHAEIQWTFRGLAAWDEYAPQLEFRPASGGEVWATEWLWATEDEEIVFLTLPLGLWSVELRDHDGTSLGVLTQIEVATLTTPEPFTMPTPESLGAKRLEFAED